MVLLLLVVACVVFFFWKKKQITSTDLNIIRIGRYHFDQRNMKLFMEKIETELTSKEADLLSLLHTSANTTLERDHILNVVWGDEGDYVGRTLDVFISKLRKKLEADPNVKIVNVRGVGYKLVLNETE
ncbi:MAG: response regulator transcription factor [Flavobacteriales bacterium]|nr:response regulator transcription factor [Flavobacteriales bacterium]